MPDSEPVEVIEGTYVSYDLPQRGIQKGDWIFRLSDGEIIHRRYIPLPSTRGVLKTMTRPASIYAAADRELAIEAAIARYCRRTFN